MSELVIDTTTAGSLPRSPELVAATKALEIAEDGFTLLKTPEYDELAQRAVTELVPRSQLPIVEPVAPGDRIQRLAGAHHVRP